MYPSDRVRHSSLRLNLHNLETRTSFQNKKVRPVLRRLLNAAFLDLVSGRQIPKCSSSPFWRKPRNNPLGILAEPICWVKGLPETCSFWYQLETDCLARGSSLIEKRIYDETMEEPPTTVTPLLQHHELTVLVGVCVSIH